ncbi:MAG TPA: hypothetical protein VM686_03555, partial [Polyangiaceae bacterium]|nr:hypothetical protein [Polyangiaceae bacterium]
MSFLTSKNKLLISLLVAGTSVAAACQVVDKGEYEFDDTKFSGTAGTSSQAGSTGDAGTGNMGGCTDGEFQCTDTGVLLACVDGAFQDEADGMDCGGAELCSAAAGTCRECLPGEFRCTDEKLEQCNLDGTAYELAATCADADSCNVSTNKQKGFCTVCEAGATVCDPKVILTAGVQGAGGPQAASELRECNDDGSGTVLSEVCGFAQPICDAAEGACMRCTPNETRCINGAVQTCNAAGSAWEEDVDCGSVALCDPMGNSGPECLAAACNVGDPVSCDSAGLIEGCGLDGQPFEIVDCPSQARCEATKRRCTDCEPGTFRCVGEDVRWCGALFLDDDSVTQTVTVRPTLPSPGTETTYVQCASGCTASGTSYNCGVWSKTLDMGTYAPGYRYTSWYDYATGGQSCPGGQYATGLDLASVCNVCRPNQVWCNADNEMIKCDADGLGTSTIEDCGNNVCAYWLEQCLPALPGDNACMPDGR